jgi:hypothetical protein
MAAMNCTEGRDRPDSTGWLGIGLRLLVTLLFLVLLVALARCGLSALSTTTPVAEQAQSHLSVQVLPAGGSVAVDDQVVGRTPVEVSLAPGWHTVRVELEGYQPLEQEILLNVGDQAGLTGELVPLLALTTRTVTPTVTLAPTPARETEPSQTETARDATAPAPTILPTTPAPTSAPRATQQPTVVPPPSPTPRPSPLPPTAVAVHEGQTTISTYPYAQFISRARNETFNVPYLVLDRLAYQASDPAPQDVVYRTVELENEYLKLVFLPDLGGRLYEVIYKPTGHRETYRNPVLKPSPWGPPEQGWWLAAGGIEWCLPVEEHGYEWGVPWAFQVSRDANAVTVTLRDTDAGDRVRAEIAVRLESGAASFAIRPRIENPTGAPLNVKYWTNAMLAPGGRNAPSADLRFVLPGAVTAVTVHSRGDDNLPAAGQRLSWPVFNGLDLSRLGNWNRWLGFFEDPAVGDFMGVYDQAYDEGMVRVFASDQVPGAKGFAMGWGDPIPATNWTDDGSGYVEVHGGPAPTFDDTVTIPAGGYLQWTETWYPVAGIGGLRFANALAALNLGTAGGQARLAVEVARPWSGDVVLLLNGQELWRRGMSLSPGQPFQTTVPLGDGLSQTGQLLFRLESSGGAVVAEYSGDFHLQ